MKVMSDEKIQSLIETKEHVEKVQEFMRVIIKVLLKRTCEHDRTKFYEPELAAFLENTPKLKTVEYGSQQYKDILTAMRPAVEHHQSRNRHHPEFFPDGIKGMGLVDLIEMFCDWKAASLRNPNGDIRKSIEMNQKRFGYSDELKQILLNTNIWF